MYIIYIVYNFIVINCLTFQYIPPHFKTEFLNTEFSCLFLNMVVLLQFS